jgi:hypothetical protein
MKNELASRVWVDWYQYCACVAVSIHWQRTTERNRTLLLCLYRLADLQAFEDSKLVLSALLHPWLGDLAPEFILEKLLPRPTLLSFISASCKSALGLPPTSFLQLGPPAASGRTGSHRHSLEQGTDVEYLPLGLAYAADCSAYAAARASVSSGAGVTDGPSTKRARISDASEESGSSLAADEGRGGVLERLQIVAQGDPRMRNRNVWWRSAALAVWELLLEGRGWGLEETRNVELVLQRAVMVAMVRPHPTWS